MAAAARLRRLALAAAAALALLAGCGGSGGDDEAAAYRAAVAGALDRVEATVEAFAPALREAPAGGALALLSDQARDAQAALRDAAGALAATAAPTEAAAAGAELVAALRAVADALDPLVASAEGEDAAGVAAFARAFPTSGPALALERATAALARLGYGAAPAEQPADSTP
ncbi:MAG: hypothetical protein R3C15_07145 [Thermoleophilia bacterium]